MAKIYKQIPSAALQYLQYAIHEHREQQITHTGAGLVESIVVLKCRSDPGCVLMGELLKSDNKLRPLIKKEEALFDELKKIAAQ
ncbi:hypothetical protein C1X05_07180 [Laceyella sacchari]|uniref:Uncharacterized protein n=1 Tax=Laceyella tengchongensis TaxID=574699 RepID=A0AA45WPA2_9BACL|nr:hypothetical protein [Laceyella tengchongensis]AUS08642.1 hypothetical protein C1X05_07180 [Laceyella sacchari]SMP21018.1 hypothetical protein SAMN06265361_103464 [Laceyella tengchongensis]